MEFDPYAAKAEPMASAAQLAGQLEGVELELCARFSMPPRDLRRQLPQMVRDCTVDEDDQVQNWLALLTALMEQAEEEARTKPPPVVQEAEQGEGPLDAALFFIHTTFHEFWNL
jgi:hypothetical protein